MVDWQRWLGEADLVAPLLQVGASALLVAAALFLTLRVRVGIEREAAWAFLRGLVQVVAMGLVLTLVLGAHAGWAVPVLVAMGVGAGFISRKRAAGMPGALGIASSAILTGSGVVLAAMVAAQALDVSMRTLVPVGSMVIASTMRATSLALERFVGEVDQERDRIEALLALGVAGPAAAGDPMRRGVRASLVPAVDTLKSLGLVWIPGIMTGLILAGTHPVQAALFQFVIIAMIFAASAVSSLVANVLASRAAFNPAEQLRI